MPPQSTNAEGPPLATVCAALESEPQVRVAVRSFEELFREARYPLAIDTYQRGFVWNDEKIDQFGADLYSFSQGGRAATADYYMGTVLLHEDQVKQKLFIIDGQQRLTALCLLHRCLAQTLPPHCEFSFSPESVRNLRRAAARLKNTAEALAPEIFRRVHFTCITVRIVDLAFTFFDTQNNRGVPLHATDLLKAFHLRAIKGSARDNLQKQSAERWERLQHGRQVLGRGEDFAPALFTKFLWRSRAWIGQNDLHFESHDALVREFQERAIPVERGDTIPLYRARGNLLGSSLSLRDTGSFQLTPCPIVLGSSPTNLPFAIRQPINQGIGFFLFAEKYAALVREILDSEHPSAEVRDFCRFYQEVVVGSVSVYLREAFLLATVLYVDQFGLERLLEFALWLDYSIGSVRIEKAYVKMEAAKNYFGKRHYNLLDMVAGAFTPQQVIDCLGADIEADTIYEKEAVETGKGVRGRYKAAILSYYGRPEQNGSLRGRKSWINPFLAKRRQEGSHAS